MSRDAVEQYLQRHAEPDLALLTNLPQRKYRHCLVVPCYRESPAFARRMLDASRSWGDALVIVVVNQSESAPVAENQASLDYFLLMNSLWQNQHLRLCQTPGSAIDWLVVDRTQPSLVLPAKYGVGLARKIGCDLAVLLYRLGALTSPWLHTTDADAHLPDGYFHLPHGGFVAAVYPFEHIQAKATQAVWQATQLYQQALRYYVAGLRWAGSPYAYQPIGSALAFTAVAYCQARGFPKRNAGEDFYLLNKLCKLGAVFTPDATVQLEARASDRVPFGTGPQVQAIVDMAAPTAQFCYYSPAALVELKAWLATVPTVWASLQSSQEPLAALGNPAQAALNEAGIQKLWRHLASQVKDARACERAVHVWFDAFQTLKFLRRLQSSVYPPRPLYNCIEEAPFQC